MLKLKVIVAGAKDVGKTTLIHRYVSGRFLANTISTIGLDFMTKKLTVDETEISLSLWDFAGEEKFRNLLPSYCSGASGALILYDITSKSSFDELDAWIKLIRENTEDRGVSILLIGSKSDLADQRQVSPEEAKKLVEEKQINKYLECSSKTGENVKNIFHTLVEDIIERSLVRCAKCNELNPKVLFCQFCGAKM